MLYFSLLVSYNDAVDIKRKLNTWLLVYHVTRKNICNMVISHAPVCLNFSSHCLNEHLLPLVIMSHNVLCVSICASMGVVAVCASHKSNIKPHNHMKATEDAVNNNFHAAVISLGLLQFCDDGCGWRRQEISQSLLKWKTAIRITIKSLKNNFKAGLSS